MNPTQQQQQQQQQQPQQRTQQPQLLPQQHQQPIVRSKISYLIQQNNNHHNNNNNNQYDNHHRFAVNKLSYYSTSDNQVNLLLSGGRDGTIKIWNANNNNQTSNNEEYNTNNNTNTTNNTKLSMIHSIDHHVDWINDQCVIQNNNSDEQFLIASASSDNTVQFHQVQLQQQQQQQQNDDDDDDDSSLFNNTNNNKNKNNHHNIIHQVNHRATIRAHYDYVKCIYYNPCKQWLITGGFDNHVNLWDLNHIVPNHDPTHDNSSNHNNHNNHHHHINYSQSHLAYLNHKNSIYTCVMNQSGSLIATGSSDQYIRLYDTRHLSWIHTNNNNYNVKPSSSTSSTSNETGVVIKLRGHQDNIRQIIMTNHDRTIVSASSDGTVKYWDVRTERCYHTFSYLFSDSVWCLHSPSSHSSSTMMESSLSSSSCSSPSVSSSMDVIAGGRDGNVHVFSSAPSIATTTAASAASHHHHHHQSMMNSSSYHLIQCNQPVLSLCTSTDLSKLYVATTTAAPGTLTDTTATTTSGTGGNSCFSIHQYDYSSRLEKCKRHRERLFELQTSSTRDATTTTTGGAMSSSGGSLGNTSPLRMRRSSSAALSSSFKGRSRSISSGTSTNVAPSSAHDHTAPNPSDPPLYSIPNAPAITQYHICNNRRHVLARDDHNRVTLWDICTGRFIKSFNEEDYEPMVLQMMSLPELEQKELFEYVAIPSWFTIQTKLGCLEVLLDYSSCFYAEVHATDAGFSDAQPDDRVNMGFLIIQALFGDWFRKRKEVEYRRAVEDDYTSSDHSDSDESNHDSDEEQSLPNKDSQGKGNDDEKSNNHDENQDDDTENEKSALVVDHSNEETKDSSVPVDTTEKTESKQPVDTIPSEATAQKEEADSQTEETKDETEAEPERLEDVFEVKLPLMYTLPGDTPVIVHNERMLSMSAIPFKQRIQDFSGSDEHARAVPDWIKECLLQGIAPRPTMQKITFFLTPMDDQLGNIPEGHSRLNASRLLRMSKVAEYVVDKLNLKLPTRQQFEAMKQQFENQSTLPNTTPAAVSASTGGGGAVNAISNFLKAPLNKLTKSPRASDTTPEENPVQPHEYLEIWCNGKLLKSEFSLGVANKFFRDPNSSVITLNYKRRYPVTLSNE